VHFFAERPKPLILLAIFRKDFFRNGRFPARNLFFCLLKTAFRKAADGTLIQGSGWSGRVPLMAVLPCGTLT